MSEKYLSSRLADYITSFSIDEASPAAIEYAKRSMCDTVGCMIAAGGDPAVATAKKFVLEMEGTVPPGEGVFSVGDTRPHLPRFAALIGGVAANTLDYDDISVVMNGHPSAVILPVILSAAQKTCISTNPGVLPSGKDVLEAYMTGVEAASALGRAVCPESFNRGWHCTSVIGIFGAVAALGKLYAADHETLVRALTVAASEASGIKANLGSSVKPFHCGRSAQKSFEILALALAGCGGNPDALEAGTGLLFLIAGNVKLQGTIEALEGENSVFLDPGIALKPYPSCKRTLNGIDCALKLRKSIQSTREIESITCFVQSEAAGEFGGAVDTPEGRKLSLPFCVAAALYYNSAGLDIFEKKWNEELLRLVRTVSIVADPQLDSMTPDATRVVIALKNGERKEYLAERAKGDMENPMSEEEVRNKFLGCCRKHLNEDEARGLLEEISSIEQKESIIRIRDYLREAR